LETHINFSSKPSFTASYLFQFFFVFLHSSSHSTITLVIILFQFFFNLKIIKSCPNCCWNCKIVFLCCWNRKSRIMFQFCLIRVLKLQNWFPLLFFSFVSFISCSICVLKPLNRESCSRSLWLKKFQKPWIIEKMKVMVWPKEDKGVKNKTLNHQFIKSFRHNPCSQSKQNPKSLHPKIR